MKNIKARMVPYPVSLLRGLRPAVFFLVPEILLLNPRHTVETVAKCVPKFLGLLLFFGPLGIFPAFFKPKSKQVLLATFFTWSGISIDPAVWARQYNMVTCELSDVCTKDEHFGPRLKHPEAKQPFYARNATTNYVLDLRSEWNKSVENFQPIQPKKDVSNEK
jgi:hypothetical protein